MALATALTSMVLPVPDRSALLSNIIARNRTYLEDRRAGHLEAGQYRSSCTDPSIHVSQGLIQDARFLSHLDKRQLHRLPNFLLLRIQSTHIRILDVRPFVCAQHGNRRVSLWREDINQGVRVSVERDGGRGLEEFSIQGGKDSDDIGRA